MMMAIRCASSKLGSFDSMPIQWPASVMDGPLVLGFGWGVERSENLLRPLPEPHLAIPEHTDSQPVRPTPTSVVRKFRPQPVMKSVDKDRMKAIALWQYIVVTAASASTLARMLEAASSEDEVSTTLQDTFAKKATSTLKSRAGSVLLFIRWGVATFGECQLFPLIELQLYRYVTFLRLNAAPPSRAERFVQAVRFSFTLLGGDGTLSSISARVTGATSEGINRKPLRKKLPFGRQQLLRLEALACGEPSHIAIFAGFICLLVYARLRFSDAQMAYDEPTVQEGENYNLLEMQLYGSKTASVRRARVFRLIPVFAISPGLIEQCWATKWLQNRKTLGLHASESEPLMRCPILGNEFSPKKLASADACIWLREILSDVTYTNDLQDVGTHSSKATILSWLSKSSADREMCRRAGYHVGKDGKSELEYAHDAAAPMVDRIALTMAMVRLQLFLPDRPRLQRWNHCSDFESAVPLVGWKAQEPPHKRPKAKNPSTVGSLLRCTSSESGSSSSETDSTGSSDEENEVDQAEVHADSNTQVDNFEDGYVYYKHAARCTVHRAVNSNDEDAVVFVCGRLASMAHREIGKRPGVILNPCASCFKGDMPQEPPA